LPVRLRLQSNDWLPGTFHFPPFARMNAPPTFRFLRLTFAALVTVLVARSADWNQWRGPNRDGRVPDFKAPAAWTPESLSKKWTVTVGEGHSSPVVSGNLVYIFARENEKEIMRCLAIDDGKIVWQNDYAAPYEMNPRRPRTRSRAQGNADCRQRARFRPRHQRPPVGLRCQKRQGALAKEFCRRVQVHRPVVWHRDFADRGWQQRHRVRGGRRQRCV